jgi:hypothetical protein
VCASIEGPKKRGGHRFSPRAARLNRRFDSRYLSPLIITLASLSVASVAQTLLVPDDLVLVAQAELVAQTELVPQIPLVAQTELVAHIELVAQTELDAQLELVAQVEVDPAIPLAPLVTAAPHIELVPEALREAQIEAGSKFRKIVLGPVPLLLNVAVGDSALPLGVYVLARAAARSRYPAPTVKMS